MILTELTAMLALAHQAMLRMPRDSMPAMGTSWEDRLLQPPDITKISLKEKNNSASTTENTSMMEISVSSCDAMLDVMEVLHIIHGDQPRLDKKGKKYLKQKQVLLWVLSSQQTLMLWRLHVLSAYGFSSNNST